MKDIAIIGAGGFGREVKMLIDQINASQPQYNFIGYFDDGLEKDSLINGHPVIGPVEAVNTWQTELGIVLAIGLPSLKKRLFAKIANPKITYPILIHPNVLIGTDDVFIGPGSIICAGNIITVNIKIGAHVIFNLGCTVGHDTVINDYCSFMPAVNVSGEVVIEEGVYVGTGAKIINQLSIGTNTIVGAGAVVYKSLPPNCTAVGIPAKPVKYND
jgi:sugar O-acyltransferase (sialic acid O-acetyltransferase NeuD family)